MATKTAAKTEAKTEAKVDADVQGMKDVLAQEIEQVQALKTELQEQVVKTREMQEDNTAQRDQDEVQKALDRMIEDANEDGEEKIFLPVIEGKTDMGQELNVSLNFVPFRFYIGIVNTMTNKDPAWHRVHSDGTHFKRYPKGVADLVKNAAGVPPVIEGKGQMQTEEFLRFKEDSEKFDAFVKESRASGRLYFVSQKSGAKRQ